MFRTIISKIRQVFSRTPAVKSSIPGSRRAPQQEKRGRNAKDYSSSSSASRPSRKEFKKSPSYLKPGRKPQSPQQPQAQPKERRVLNKKITIPPPPPMPELLDIPPEEGKTRFQDLPLAKQVLAGTQQAGFKYCSVIQQKCLPYALAGRDLAAKAQTGTGKTAAFLCACMTKLLEHPKENRRPRTCRVLILEPTRELALQIEKDAEVLGKYTGLYSIAIFGGMDYKGQRDSLGIGVDILAGTPGRIIDYCGQGALDLSETEVLVIDEADRMLDMGFIPDVRRIVAKLPPPGKRQTMLFSATLEHEVLRLVERWLVDPVSVEAEPEHVVTDLIDQKFYAVTEAQKIPFLVWLIQHEPVERMLIFGNWKHKNEKVAAELASYGVPCEQLSGDIPQNRRIQILERFKSGDCKVLVATDVAARGLHVDGISHVVNFDVPDQAEDYVHRIGRTGRAGHKGTSITFVCEIGAYNMPAVEKYAGIKAVTVQPDEQCLIAPERKFPLKSVRSESHGGFRGGSSRGGFRGGYRGGRSGGYLGGRR